MQFLKQLFNFYINASIHVALVVYVFVRITELYFDLPYNEVLDSFIFYGTITGYNFVKYFGIAKFHHRSLTKDLKIIQVFSLFCFAMMVYFAIQLSFKIVFIYALFGLLTILYAIPFLSGFQKNLRTISYLKIIIVAFVWAGVTVIAPVLDAGFIFANLEVFLVFLQRFLLVIVLILPFDIRDLQFDAISLHTLPQKIGVMQTKRLGYILLLVALLIEFVIAPDSSFRNAFLVFFFSATFFLTRAKTNQSKYYSSFWVEALPVFWYLVLLGIRNF